jgi:hypothetical protein
LDFLQFRFVSEPLTACRRPDRTRLTAHHGCSSSSDPLSISARALDRRARDRVDRDPTLPTLRAWSERIAIPFPPAFPAAGPPDLALHGKQRHPKKLGRFLRGEDLRFVVTRQRANPSSPRLSSNPSIAHLRREMMVRAPRSIVRGPFRDRCCKRWGSVRENAQRTIVGVQIIKPPLSGRSTTDPSRRVGEDCPVHASKTSMK